MEIILDSYKELKVGDGFHYRDPNGRDNAYTHKVIKINEDNIYVYTTSSISKSYDINQSIEFKVFELEADSGYKIIVTNRIHSTNRFTYLE